MVSDRVYYERRAAEERSAAMGAAHPRVREVHLEMAAAYEQRLQSLAAQELEPSVTLTDVA
jgi:hypothetical protein